MKERKESIPKDKTRKSKIQSPPPDLIRKSGNRVPYLSISSFERRLPLLQVGDERAEIQLKNIVKRRFFIKQKRLSPPF